jgi:hypothetical protein
MKITIVLAIQIAKIFFKTIKHIKDDKESGGKLTGDEVVGILETLFEDILNAIGIGDAPKE